MRIMPRARCIQCTCNDNTRRMLSIVGERELRLHSDSHVNIFLSRRGCFKYYFFLFCVCLFLVGYLFIYASSFSPFSISLILVCCKRELSCTALGNNLY